ncbi:hypothetical protein ES703_07707 [subsurface metagenome]
MERLTLSANLYISHWSEVYTLLLMPHLGGNKSGELIANTHRYSISIGKMYHTCPQLSIVQ